MDAVPVHDARALPAAGLGCREAGATTFYCLTRSDEKGNPGRWESGATALVVNRRRSVDQIGTASPGTDGVRSVNHAPPAPRLGRAENKM